MKYFKNAELVRLYNVSDKAVRNWVDNTIKGKLSLDLYYHDNKPYVADTLVNSRILEELVQRGRKFRNHRSHRTIQPKEGFFDLYRRQHVIDIIRNLDAQRELPVAYAYFGVGAETWDKYLHKLYSADKGNLLTNTIEALELNYSYLESLFSGYENINIVNLCIGNSLAIKELVKHVKATGKLRRLIAIDISEDMLKISSKNVASWFDEPVMETYQRDLSYQRFDDILTLNSFGANASKTLNLISFVAGPIVNFKDPDQPLHTIRNSMGKDDLLITTLKRDTEQTRKFFDFNIESDKGLLSTHDKMLLDLLNIDEALYEVEQLFDESKKLRFVQVRLKLDVSIVFNIKDYEKTIHFKKGESILIWRSWQHSDQDIFERFNRTGFEVLQFSRSRDQQLNLLISKIKTAARCH